MENDLKLSSIQEIKDDSSNLSSKKSLSSLLLPTHLDNKKYLMSRSDLNRLENTNQEEVIKESNKPIKVIYIFFSSIFISLSIFFPKYLYYTYHDNFNIILFLLSQSLAIIIILPLIFRYYRENSIFIVLNNLEHKRWFFLRANLNFIGTFFYIISLYYFRCVTVQITIIGLIPIIGLLGNYIFLGNFISQSLIFGLFCVLTGDSLVFYNELIHCKNKSVIDNIIGIFTISISFLSYGSIKIINHKYVSLNNYSLLTHMINNQIVFFIYCIVLMIPILIFKEIKISFKFLILSAIAGIFYLFGVFFIVIVLQKKKLDVIKFNTKLTGLNLVCFNFNIIYVCVLCYLLCGEETYFNDFVAAIIIFLFKIFNGNIEQKDNPCYFI